MPPKDAERVANSEYPDQTALEEQSGLGLHCLLRIICLKTFWSYKVNKTDAQNQLSLL